MPSLGSIRLSFAPWNDPAAKPYISFRNVTKRFGDFVAVDNLSLDVYEREFFSLLGPSGCGKTTLLRMLAGFEEPTEGEIFLDGQSLKGVPPHKRPVNMMFQSYALFPHMSVADNIAFGLKQDGMEKGARDERVAQMLKLVKLEEFAKRKPDQLSGGQRQRVALARAVAKRPKLLLLDEPLGALDLKLREAMKIELKLLQNQFDTTFVYITHDQSEALVMSDHVAVMNNGRFEQIGTPQQLYHQPKTAFVAGFVGDAKRWAGKVTAVNGGEAMVETEGGMVARCRSGEGSSIATGDAVTLFVRHEFIELGHGRGTPGENRLAGKVDSLLFNGANSRALVRLDSGDLVEVDITLTGGTDDVKEGEEVKLSWQAENAVCFKSGAGQ